MRAIRRAILETLAYADVFDFPLKENELWRYLLRTITTLRVFRNALEQLVEQGIVINDGAYYSLKPGLAKMRLKKERIAAQKMHIALKAVRLIQHIPTVEFVGISGSLAMANTQRTDDIDFFIITSPNLLWFTRLLVVGLLDLKRWRRKVGVSQVTDKICINMWMDGKRLALSHSHRDIFTAHEIAQMKPVYDKKGIYYRFLYQNRWIRVIFPQIGLPFNKLKPQPVGKILPGLGFLEIPAARFQLWYMRKKRTREIIGKTLLKFHPQDARTWVMREYHQKLSHYNLSAKTNNSKPN